VSSQQAERQGFDYHTDSILGAFAKKKSDYELHHVCQFVRLKQLCSQLKKFDADELC
jgi:hypothetical protein